MNNTKSLLVLGEINPDIILLGEVDPRFGQAEKLVESFKLTIGSSGAIFACGAAKLGFQTTFIGIAGDDLFGHFILKEMEQRGVSIESVRIRPDLQTGFSVILTCKSGDRAILTYLGSINALRVEDIDRNLLGKASHLHIASFYLQANLHNGLRDFLTEAKGLDMVISLDPNWDPDEQWNGELKTILPYVDVFLPNDIEAMAVTGKKDVDSALIALSDVIPTVAIKMGNEGAVASHLGQHVRCQSYPVEFRDATGAGDSFDAGFLAGLAYGYDAAMSLEIGCACGALSTRALGGVGSQASIDEALAFIKKNHRIR